MRAGEIVDIPGEIRYNESIQTDTNPVFSLMMPLASPGRKERRKHPMSKWNKWDCRFMEMAHVIAGWTSCFMPGRSIGCVIVKDKRIMTTGYNGAPAGLKTCKERGECMRRRLGIQSGTRAELCYAIHAEQNAIIQAAKLGVSIDGATLYCTHQPCSVCAKMIVNAGITRVVYQEGYPDEFSLEIFKEANVLLERFDPQEAQQD